MIFIKVLTIKNPWASLIVNNYKKYEFRSWKTNYRGKILIHAGLGSDDTTIFSEYNLKYVKGAIIGEADLVDCILVTESFDKQLKNMDSKIYSHNHENLYAWKLENIKKYDKPIYVKGKLGLWNYDV